MGVHEGNSESEDVASKILYATLLTTCSLSAPQYPQAEVYPYEPPVYAYQYAVSDPSVSGSVFSAQESRNDLEASGDYRVSLPDGRTQIVTYTISGPQGGYVANVQYDGEASYPDSTVKAAPLHAVVQPVTRPIAVAKPVFHSAPLAVAPSSYNPVLFSPVVRPSSYTPVVRVPSYRASPVVFQPAPTPNRYSYTVKEKEPQSDQEERTAKEAVIIEEAGTTQSILPQNNKISLNANTPSIQTAKDKETNIQTTTVTSVTTKNQDLTTPPVSSSSENPILAVVTPTVLEEEITTEQDSPISSDSKTKQSLATSQSQYYFKFLR